MNGFFELSRQIVELQHFFALFGIDDIAIAMVVASVVSAAAAAGSQAYASHQQAKAAEKASKNQQTVLPSKEAAPSQESSSDAEAQARNRMKKAAMSGRSGTQLTGGGGTSL